MKPSRGTVIPADVRRDVQDRDQGCVCERAGFPAQIVAACGGELQPDHVRASHGMGMKSASSRDNLVMLSANSHRWKTANGRLARPLLIRYLERFDDR